MEFQVKNICDKCGEVNELDNINLKRALVTCVQTGEDAILTYYICKRCSTLKVLQIDDSVTTKTFTELKKLITRTAKKKLKGKPIPLDADEKKDKLIGMMDKRRADLMEKFSGKDFKKDEKIFLKNLTFSQRSDIIDSDM